MDYPDNCVRGISREEDIVEVRGSRHVSFNHFQFQKARARDDGWLEESINWEDDCTVIEFTLNQKTDTGEIRFRAGVAVIPRSVLDDLSSHPVSGVMEYERQPLESNPYHGNILVHASIPKDTKRMIRGRLASEATVIPRRLNS